VTSIPDAQDGGTNVTSNSVSNMAAQFAAANPAIKGKKDIERLRAYLQGSAP